MVLHVRVGPAIPPRSLANKGDVMRTLTCAAVVLAAIAGAAPVMAQSIQAVAPAAPLTIQTQPPADAPAWAYVRSPADMSGQAEGSYNAYGQPNQVYGIPGAGQSSASSHPAE
jgi:hypothetical protein